MHSVGYLLRLLSAEAVYQHHNDYMNGVYCNHKNVGKTAVYKSCTQEISREFFLSALFYSAASW